MLPHHLQSYGQGYDSKLSPQHCVVQLLCFNKEYIQKIVPTECSNCKCSLYFFESAGVVHVKSYWCGYRHGLSEMTKMPQTEVTKFHRKQWHFGHFTLRQGRYPHQTFLTGKTLALSKR